MRTAKCQDNYVVVVVVVVVDAGDDVDCDTAKMTKKNIGMQVAEL